MSNREKEWRGRIVLEGAPQALIIKNLPRGAPPGPVPLGGTVATAVSRIKLNREGGGGEGVIL